MPAEDIKKIRDQALMELKKIDDLSELEQWEIKYLGRKQGKLSAILRGLPALSLETRRVIGTLANEAKVELERVFLEKKSKLLTGEGADVQDVDVTLPAPFNMGGLHPLTMAQRELEDIFSKLGFVNVEGPEIESDYYNFEALNMPKGHPARDLWDTFYVKTQGAEHRKQTEGNLVLRTHTSPMQIRMMEKYKPPFAVIVPGRTYRSEATDARHEHTIDQLEGLAVGDDISVANMKHVLQTVLSEFFGTKSGEALDIKLRPSYFPFVEPGFEVAVECVFCSKKGCRVCGAGYLELLGAGMVHPYVFDAVGYPKGKYTGFAFGMGIARLAMIKYGVPDIRLFAENDYKFLTQH